MTATTATTVRRTDPLSTSPPWWFRLSTPRPGAAGGCGAIAEISLAAATDGVLDDVLTRLGAGGVRMGRAGLREVARIDQAVVARWSERSASIMPHAGAAAVGGIIAALVQLGGKPGEPLDAMALYPEAQDEIEARMLVALGQAASPLAVDLLLVQPPRWRAGPPTGTAAERARWRRLNRLIHPPLVAAVGSPNIGKSSLLNALAGRGASIVADEPGTTRDHVGVTLELAGLTVRYLDLPGLGRPRDELDAAAQALARSAAARADLVLRCRDPLNEAPAWSAGVGQTVLEVGLRGDLGAIPGVAACVSVKLGEGLASLVAAVREALVPGADLADPGPWKFWEA